MKRIRTGIIGQGRSGRGIHRHLLESSEVLRERFDVVAVADPIAERWISMHPEYANPDCRCYADYREMLKDQDIDLIINASRSHRHADISIEAMRAGFDVICEKPLAKTVAEVDRVLNVQKNTGKFFAVFQQSRFRPAFQQVCDIIRSGVLGEIAMIKLRHHSFGRRWDWQTVQAMNGGELLNTAPHPLDQTVALWDIFGEGMPEKIYSCLRNFNNAGDAEDFVKIILEGKDHPVIDLEVIKQTNFPSAWCQVYAANGSLTSDGSTIEWKYFRKENNPMKKLEINTLETDGRLPVFPTEKLEFISDKWCIPEEKRYFLDDWGIDYYKNIYDAITVGTPVIIQLSQVRRQIAIIEECHRQNPLTKTVVIPDGID